MDGRVPRFGAQVFGGGEDCEPSIDRLKHEHRVRIGLRNDRHSALTSTFAGRNVVGSTTQRSSQRSSGTWPSRSFKAKQADEEGLPQPQAQRRWSGSDVP